MIRIQRINLGVARSILLGCVAVLLVFLALWLLNSSRLGTSPPQRFNGQVLESPEFAAGWPATAQVQDHEGRFRQLADFRGKVVLLFFGYTQCPDVCPTALQRASEVFRQLGHQAESVQVLFMTLDPERDTLPLLSAYVPAFDTRFLGLRPSTESVPELARDFRVFYQINPGKTPESYTLDHGINTYVYDPKGRLRLSIGHDASAEAVAEDVLRLLEKP